MNIILVSNSHKTPITLDLRNVRNRALVVAGLAVAVLSLMALGVAMTWLIYSPKDRMHNEVQSLRWQITQQHHAVSNIRQQAQRDVNALAIKLGLLEAQSYRLDALGERLAHAGKLGGAEFDFNRSPGMGGPAPAQQEAFLLPPDLSKSISKLDKKFQNQKIRLHVLENLMLNRKLDVAARPTGMPVKTGYIDSYFGDRPDPFGGGVEFHPGLDIAARLGTPIDSVAAGIVIYAGKRGGYGNAVAIDHGNGYSTLYGHAEKLLVHVGERVRAGQEIALLGSTGRSTGPHVHFEVRYRGRPVNPLSFVRHRR